MPRYWLFKSEPNVYSIDDLKRDGRTFWDGVRNYQARNLLRDEIRVGDGVLYYHSRVDPMAVVGLAKVSEAGAPDPSQFDRRSKYYDDKATKQTPRWFGVTVSFDKKFGRPVTLKEMRDIAALKKMVLLNRSRLSVQPVRADEWKWIVKRGQAKG